MDEVAVKLTRVSKKYILDHEKPTLVENLLNMKNFEEFWALRNINLEIRKGERVGLVGPNGAGKTTLLRIITGISTPTTGTVTTYGKLVSLIGINTGFQPDLTGQENVLLNGMLIGMEKNEVKSKIKKIIRFAGIEKFIDSPFYTYSAGMALRLGFSIAIHSNPDILVLDEDINIGDQQFQEKAKDKINKFFKSGKTVLMASHQLYFLKRDCKRIIWLDKGKVREDGDCKSIIRRYTRPTDL